MYAQIGCLPSEKFGYLDDPQVDPDAFVFIADGDESLIREIEMPIVTSSSAEELLKDGHSLLVRGDWPEIAKLQRATQCSVSNGYYRESILKVE